jgi:hypothetical protein
MKRQPVKLLGTLYPAFAATPVVVRSRDVEAHIAAGTVAASQLFKAQSKRPGRGWARELAVKPPQPLLMS